MSSPRLSFPPADYEAYTASDAVRQRCMLDRVLASMLGRYRPASRTTLGSRGGASLKALAGGRVERVIAVDITPD